MNGIVMNIKILNTVHRHISWIKSKINVNIIMIWDMFIVFAGI